MKVNRVWLWLIPLTLLWPVLQWLVFLIRFGEIPGNATDFLTFLPMSLIAGAMFLALWVRTSGGSQKTCLILGYLFSSPIAFVGSLLSGLVVRPIIGTLLWGAGPLVFGMLIGIFAGTMLDNIRPDRERTQ